MRLKPGLCALWRSPTEAQVGSDPRITRRIGLEDPAEFAVLEALTLDHSIAQLRGILIREHLDPVRADALATELVDAGLVQDSPNTPSWVAVRMGVREMLAAAAESRGILGGDGWSAVAAIGQATVHVVGLGRTGARVAACLASAGVGHLVLSDSMQVSPRDVGTDYAPADVGSPRCAALKARIRSLTSECVVATGPTKDEDVTVLVNHDVSDILHARDLTYRDVPHVAVLIEDASATVGPWVKPGHGPCLRCLALHFTDDDPLWPTLATQLSARRSRKERGEDPTMAALVGAYAAAQVVSFLTNGTTPCDSLTVTFSLPDYATSAIEWEPHPSCGCTGLETDPAGLYADSRRRSGS
jgi:bacteriocin biosynthesis cyclodehydratase domain-containing protein